MAKPDIDKIEHFFKMAANERKELPADIIYYIKDNPEVMHMIRENMGYSINNETEEI